MAAIVYNKVSGESQSVGQNNIVLTQPSVVKLFAEPESCFGL